MTELLHGAIEQMSSWPPWGSYTFLGLSAFLENVIPPVPGDTVVVFGAYLVGLGVLRWEPVFFATSAGGTLGFMVMWYVGLTHGRSFLEGHSRRVKVFSEKHMQRAEVWLERYGLWLVVANRFLTGIRSAIALSAGIARMRFRGVLLMSMLGMMAWNAILLGAGLMVGRNWNLVLEWVSVYNRLGMLLLVSLLLAFLGRRWYRRRKAAVAVDR